MTRQWWKKRKPKYHLYASQYVLDEASRGDEAAASKRMEALNEIDLLEVDEEVIRLVRVIMTTGLIPLKQKLMPAILQYQRGMELIS